MPNVNTTRYPLDYTGVSPDNKVGAEVGTLADKSIRSYTPRYTPFFTESVVVKDRFTNLPLVKGVDYKCLDLVDVATAISAKEICSTIVIFNTSVTSDIEVTYQCLGGIYQNSYESIANLLDALSKDSRPVWWDQIFDRPDEFEPTEHQHSIGQGLGFEYLVQAIDKLGDTIKLGDEVGHDNLRAYIDEQTALLKRMHWDSFNDRINNVAVDAASIKQAAAQAKTDSETTFNYIQARAGSTVITPEVNAIVAQINLSKASALSLYP